MQTVRIVGALVAALALLPSAALAHTGTVGESGFLSGLSHPVGGLDHVLAMVAVGLLGAQMGAPAIWALPVAFPVVMALGGLLGLLGIALPAVEIGIAASAVVLGALVLAALRLPLAAAVILVGAFAVFHGHAHGTELPEGADGLAYSLGFVISTGLLHGAGILMGLAWGLPAGRIAVRIAGLVVAMGGLFFLTEAMG